eukprot:snap_masked-scaffold_36-processed-gene-0.28-mRNA-1 protein AED:1.00 eAED:1.00 QI:0/0/0/0/1/1/2/0/168
MDLDDILDEAAEELDDLLDDALNEADASMEKTGSKSRTWQDTLNFLPLKEKLDMLKRIERDVAVQDKFDYSRRNIATGGEDDMKIVWNYMRSKAGIESDDDKVYKLFQNRLENDVVQYTKTSPINIEDIKSNPKEFPLLSKRIPGRNPVQLFDLQKHFFVEIFFRSES